MTARTALIAFTVLISSFVPVLTSAATSKCVAEHRWNNSIEHLYTQHYHADGSAETSYLESHGWWQESGMQGAFTVMKSNVPGTVELQRVTGRIVHLATIPSWDQPRKFGFYAGRTGYVFTKPGPGRIPLHAWGLWEWWWGAEYTRFLSTNKAEGDNYVGYNKSYSGIIAYVPRSGTAADCADSPTVALIATPPSITSGQSSTLTWSSTNATSCIGDGFSTNDATSNATGVSVTPAVTTVYGITCTGQGGSVSRSAIVTVTPATSDPTCSLDVNPDHVKVGQQSTLSYKSSDADASKGLKITENGNLYDTETANTKGSPQVAFDTPGTVDFVGTVWDVAGGQHHCSASLTVNPLSCSCPAGFDNVNNRCVCPRGQTEDNNGKCNSITKPVIKPIGACIVNQPQTYTIVASDSESGVKLRYGFDWESTRTVDEWWPKTAPFYIPSGQVVEVTHIWTTTGPHTFQALAEDNTPGKNRSEWVSVPPFNCIDNSCRPGPWRCLDDNKTRWNGCDQYEVCPGSCLDGRCVDSVPDPDLVKWGVAPLLVKKENKVTVMWQVKNALSCTVDGTNGPGNHWTGSTNDQLYTQTSGPIHAQTIFTLDCTPLAGSTAAHIHKTATVNIIPNFNEK